MLEIDRRRVVAGRPLRPPARTLTTSPRAGGTASGWEVEVILVPAEERSAIDGSHSSSPLAPLRTGGGCPPPFDPRGCRGWSRRWPCLLHRPGRLPRGRAHGGWSAAEPGVRLGHPPASIPAAKQGTTSPSYVVSRYVAKHAIPLAAAWRRDEWERNLSCVQAVSWSDATLTWSVNAGSSSETSHLGSWPYSDEDDRGATARAALASTA